MCVCLTEAAFPNPLGKLGRWANLDRGQGASWKEREGDFEVGAEF